MKQKWKRNREQKVDLFFRLFSITFLLCAFLFVGGCYTPCYKTKAFRTSLLQSETKSPKKLNRKELAKKIYRLIGKYERVLYFPSWVEFLQKSLMKIHSRYPFEVLFPIYVKHFKTLPKHLQRFLLTWMHQHKRKVISIGITKLRRWKLHPYARSLFMYREPPYSRFFDGYEHVLVRLNVTTLEPSTISFLQRELKRKTKSQGMNEAHAILMLSKTRPITKETIQSIFRKLHSPKPLVRQSAIRYIGNLGSFGRKAVPILLKESKKTKLSDDMFNYLASSLRRITLLAPKGILSFSKPPNSLQVLHALRLLSYLGPKAKEYRAKVIPYLQAREWKVRLAANHALFQMQAATRSEKQAFLQQVQSQARERQLYFLNLLVECQALPPMFLLPWFQVILGGQYDSYFFSPVTVLVRRLQEKGRVLLPTLIRALMSESIEVKHYKIDKFVLTLAAMINDDRVSELKPLLTSNKSFHQRCGCKAIIHMKKKGKLAYKFTLKLLYHTGNGGVVGCALFALRSMGKQGAKAMPHVLSLLPKIKSSYATLAYFLDYHAESKMQFVHSFYNARTSSLISLESLGFFMYAPLKMNSFLLTQLEKTQLIKGKLLLLSILKGRVEFLSGKELLRLASSLDSPFGVVRRDTVKLFASNREVYRKFFSCIVQKLRDEDKTVRAEVVKIVRKRTNMSERELHAVGRELLRISPLERYRKTALQLEETLRRQWKKKNRQIVREYISKSKQFRLRR